MNCPTCDWKVKENHVELLAKMNFRYCPQCGEYLKVNRPDIP